MPQMRIDEASTNHEPTIQISSGTRSWVFRVICVLIMGSSVLVSGCRDDGTTIWSKDVRSPDGHWLASAVTKQWSGPGNAYVATTVYLKWINSSQPPTEILGFSNDTAYPAGITNVQMEWATPKHLNVTYGSHAMLDFQAIKCSDIDISVQNTSGSTTGTFAP